MPLSDYANMRCPYCGGSIINDPITHSYVCSACGVVYGYDIAPSFSQTMYSSPMIVKTKVDHEIINKAREVFGDKASEKIDILRRSNAKEVLNAVDAILRKKTHKVSWQALRDAINVVSVSNIDVNISERLAEIREKKIREAIERIIRENNVNTDPWDVWVFTLKNKHLWGGRRSISIAQIFTYLYCKKRLNIHLEIDKRLEKVAKALERVVVFE